MFLKLLNYMRLCFTTIEESLKGFGCLLFYIILTLECQGQFTLGGSGGHLIVPSGEASEDNYFAIGATFYPGKHFYLNRNRDGVNLRGDNSETYYFASFNFLKKLDIVLNVSRINNVDNVRLNGIGDRSMQLKLSMVTESRVRPSISLVSEIPLGKNNYLAPNAIIVSKNVNLFMFSIGYGSDFVFGRSDQDNFYASILGIELQRKRNEYLNGFLIGCTYTIFNKSSFRPQLMAEFDGDKINAGLRLTHQMVELNIFAPGLNSIAVGFIGVGVIR